MIAVTLPEPTSYRVRAWQVAVLALILFIAGYIRIAEARRSNLDADEIWSLMLSTGRGSVHITTPEGVVQAHLPATTSLDGAPSVVRVPQELSDATHPPGYYTLLGVFRRVVADGEFASRLFSIGLCLGAIVLLFDAVGRLVNPGAGLWAAALMALSRPMGELAGEIRPYGLVLFAVTLAMAGYARVWRSGREKGVVSHGGAAMLAGGVLGMLCGHYFASGLVLAMGVATLLLPLGKARRAAMAAVIVPSMVFLATWAPFFLRQAQAGRFRTDDENTVFLARGPRSLSWMLMTPAAVPGRLLYVPLHENVQWELAFGVVWVLPLVMRRRIPATAALGLWAVGGIFAPYVLDVMRGTGQVEYRRYTLIAFPAMAGLLGAVPYWLRLAFGRPLLWGMGQLVPAGACTLAALSLPATFADLRYSLKDIAQTIDRVAGPGDPLVFAGTESPAYVPRTFMMGYSHYHTADRPIVVTRKPLSPGAIAELEALRPAGGSIWVVTVPGSTVMGTTLPGYRLEGWKFVPGTMLMSRMVPAVSSTQPSIRP